MKKYKILTAFVVIFLPLFIDGCKSLTDGYSTDPVNITNPSVIQDSHYLSGLQVNVIGAYEADIARQTGMWVGYFSGDQRQYASLADYITSSGDYNTEWITIYSGVLFNAKILKKKATSEGNLVTVGITQIMEAMVLGLAADLWGDVPNSDALEYPLVGVATAAQAHPKYDPQSTVYAAVQAKLDSALTNLAGAGNSDGDVFLGGSVTNYALVAHTLKARYYLHIRDYTDAIAQASQGVGTGTNDNTTDMMAPHGPNYLANFNLYYSFMNYDRAGYMGGGAYCPTLIDPNLANNHNVGGRTDETARFNYLYLVHPEIYNNDAYDPNYICAFDWGSPVGEDGFFGGVTYFPLVTFAENQLIWAEALLKQSSPDFNNALGALNTLRAFYNNGNPFVVPGSTTSTSYTSLSHAYIAYLASDFNSGGIMNTNNTSPNAALLREILTEKYISLIGQIESFNDLRRTGNYLNLPILPTGKTQYPQRLLYPQIEINTNAANVPTSNVGLFNPVTSFSTAY